MLISLVTGTYNRLPLLQNMITSARACLPRGIDLEIILVDGGSTDGTIDWCATQSDITLIPHGKLLGAVRAFTDGANVARGRYVVLANDDITFHPLSILKAIVHLEEHAKCGAVAFEDNRRVDPYYPTNDVYHVLTAPAQRNGATVYVPYAQVGMFRRWLGNTIGWWGADDPKFNARTYGADNYLSSKIWELGYSVDRVDGCRIDDSVVDDDLREHNRNQHPERDSEAYYDLWRDSSGRHIGPTIPNTPALPQQDKRALRILYLPIFEAGCDVQYAQKRGLRDALARVGWVWEFDYCNQPEGKLRENFLQIIREFQPDILFTQLHGANLISESMLREARSICPTMLFLNWNGDTHRTNLVSPVMLTLLQQIDMQLVVNNSVMDTYRDYNIASAYWQIAFEPVDERSLPDVSKYDVIMQGSAYNDNRKRIGSLLRQRYGDKLGLYGDYWNDPLDPNGVRIRGDENFIPAGTQGRSLYDFALGRALYKNSKISVASNEFPNDYGFFSNRVFECLAAGGAILLQQRVPGLTELTGLTDGIHLIEWSDFDDLLDKISWWLDKKRDSARRKMAKIAREFVFECHSFDTRVKELFVGVDDKPSLLAPIKRKLQTWVGLRYLGMASQLGVPGLQDRQYECNPPKILYVHPDDVPYIINQYGDVFEVVNDIAPEDARAQGVAAYGG